MEVCQHRRARHKHRVVRSRCLLHPLCDGLSNATHQFYRLRAMCNLNGIAGYRVEINRG